MIINTVDGAYVMGNNKYGQLGLGDYNDRKIPTKLKFEYEIISIHYGYNHSIINSVDGLYVFGNNDYGQLGLGDNVDRNIPTKLNFNYEVLSIHCEGHHTIINSVDGLYVFGNNTYGQLGLEDLMSRNIPTKLNFNKYNEYEILSIHCGWSHTIINSVDGLYVFGDNQYGQLGLGDRISRNIPTKLEFKFEILSIHCGWNNTIVNSVDGLYVFGENYLGQLGLGDDVDRKIPTKLNFNKYNEYEIISIHCGSDHTIINSVDGLYVFGENNVGQLGLGNRINRNTPIELGDRININTPIKLDLTKYNVKIEILMPWDIYCGDYCTIINISNRLFIFGDYDYHYYDDKKNISPKIIAFEHELFENFKYKQQRLKSARK